MTRKYNISAITYSLILVFGVFFYFTLLGASGHRINLKIEHYLIPIYVFINVFLLVVFPKIPIENKIIRNIMIICVILFLFLSLFFAIKNLVEILSENLIFGFVFFALIVTGIFIISITYLFLEFFKNLKGKH